MILAVIGLPLWGLIIFTGIGFFCLFFYIILKLFTTILKSHIAEMANADPLFNLRNYLLKTYLIAHGTILLTFYASLENADTGVLYLI